MAFHPGPSALWADISPSVLKQILDDCLVGLIALAYENPVVTASAVVASSAAVLWYFKGSNQETAPELGKDGSPPPAPAYAIRG